MARGRKVGIERELARTSGRTLAGDMMEKTCPIARRLTLFPSPGAEALRIGEGMPMGR